LRLGNIHHAEVSGDASDAQDAEEGGVRDEGDGRDFLELAPGVGVDQDVILQAGETNDLVAFFVLWMV
jgi:hypothetical protein